MKRLMLLLLVMALMMPVVGLAQSAGEFGIKFSGFVKTDVMFDSRQTVTAREGHFLLYPAGESLDANGDDINAVPNFNILSIQSRLTGTITAPDAFGAKVSGVIEGAFFGHSDADVNGFRLRHAFVKLDWEYRTLIIGQYWHPMFITEVFPGVVSFNTGVPFQPFSRNPQIRYICKKMKPMEMTLTAAAQRDFASIGPNPTPGGPNITSSQFSRNAVIPILDLNIKLKKENMVVGAGFNYKSLQPRLYEITHYSEDHPNGVKVSTDEKVNSLAMMAFAKMTSGNMTVKAEGVYGQNMTDLLMLGGYAEMGINSDGLVEYTNTKTMSVWGELIMKMEDSPITLGLFGGYTKNMGTVDENTGVYYSRGANIETVMRVSPRIEYQVGKTRFSTELEYTGAAYGAADVNGEFDDTTSVNNIRLLMAAYLFF